MSPLHRASPPFGLRNGSTFTPAPSLKSRLDGYAELQVPGRETVWASGEVDLGDAVRLLRFYLDNEDYWLQVLMNGNQPGDIVLFGYHSATPVRDQVHLERLAGSQSKVGQPIYEHEGYLYSRQWGQAPGQAELVGFHERVANPQDRYVIRHRSMLYARDTGLLDRREFLLFSLEEDDEGALAFTTSLGVTLFPTDFNVS
ncbi:DUF2491 family protein [Pseudomonas sp. NPDC089401]|uniref:DUF2491 family protein n=1 Tax=Pseudomonas sp. NPDC089401 TaxID=3364462 RepID=UPI003803B260